MNGHIEDIPAGAYEILIEVNERPADGVGLGHKLLAFVRRDVTVPPIPGGRSDQPLDLGAIRLDAVKGAAEEPGTRKP